MCERCNKSKPFHLYGIGCSHMMYLWTNHLCISLKHILVHLRLSLKKTNRELSPGAAHPRPHALARGRDDRATRFGTARSPPHAVAISDGPLPRPVPPSLALLHQPEVTLVKLPDPAPPSYLHELRRGSPYMGQKLKLACNKVVQSLRVEQDNRRKPELGPSNPDS